MTKAKEHKDSKTLKGQLLGAVAMMIVAAVALGTSTYAWFINNQTIEVKNMQLTVSTATSMLVAVGKPASVSAADKAYAEADYTTFKTVIGNEDITGDAAADFGGWTNFLSNTMWPASTVDTQLTAGTFPTFYKSLDKLEKGKVAEFEAITVKTTDATNDMAVGQGPVKHLRLAFQPSADLDVYFGKYDTAASATLANIAELITPAKATGTPGDPTQEQLNAQAAAIKAALRVAIVPQTSATYTASVPAVFQFDAGAPAFAALSGNNTYYDKVETAGDPSSLLKDAAGGKIPDSTKVSDTLGIYAGISGVAVDAPHNPTTVNKLTALLPTDGNKRVAAVTQAADGSLKVDATGKTSLFNLKANEPRVIDIYIWLEGTDADCVNSLSEYTFNLDLPFAAAPTVAP